MTKERESFVSFLKKQGLKLTDQREEILNSFLKTEKHLSVEELYAIVKKKDPKVGQATVFRTLKLLCLADLAQEIDLGDKKTRYEHKYGHTHHDHLVCKSCGKCIEVLDFNLERLQNKLCQKLKFRPQRHRLEIFGICKDCAKEM